MEVINLNKSYGKKRALIDFNLQCQKKQSIAVLGHNGSGKTTAFRLIVGLIFADSGRIDKKSLNTISYVPERRSLYLDITVKRHFKFIGRLYGLDAVTFKNRYQKLIKLFTLEDYQNSFVQALSKGNQQKVQIALALLREPDLLIMDEPFTGLDVVNIKKIKKVLSLYQSRGLSILISSHQYDDLEDFVDRVILLKKGQTLINENIRKIREDHPYLYVTVSEDPYGQFSNEKGVFSTYSSGHVSRYQIKKDSTFLNSFVKNLNSSQVIIEEIRLKDLVECYYA